MPGRIPVASVDGVKSEVVCLIPSKVSSARSCPGLRALANSLHMRTNISTYKTQVLRGDTGLKIHLPMQGWLTGAKIWLSATLRKRGTQLKACCSPVTEPLDLKGGIYSTTEV